MSVTRDDERGTSACATHLLDCLPTPPSARPALYQLSTIAMSRALYSTIFMISMTAVAADRATTVGITSNGMATPIYGSAAPASEESETCHDPGKGLCSGGDLTYQEAGRAVNQRLAANPRRLPSKRFVPCAQRQGLTETSCVDSNALDTIYRCMGIA